MATTTPKELTKSTYITFKPAYKDCNLSPIDLARIAASADGYTVRKNEEGTPAGIGLSTRLRQSVRIDT